MVNGDDAYSFGELLKSFRKSKNVTQQQLAKATGIHRNTIGRWEQGDFLPESKKIVLELARRLHLNDQEARLLLEASFTTLSPPWNVPYRRNLFFTGRKESLDILHQCLSTDQPASTTYPYAIYGLGGVGKTQLAIEYAYTYALEYSAVLWIRAESSENIITSFFEIAKLLHLPEQQMADQQQIVLAVQQWLTSYSKWLLIWDNLEDIALLTHYLPIAYKGAVLITTRRQTLGNIARGLELLPMTHEEGLLFLLRRTKAISPEDTYEHAYQFAQRRQAEYAAARDMVMLVDGLPLALDQIGAYIEETNCGFASYLQVYRQHSGQLMDRRGMPAEDHPQSVVATLSLSYECVRQTNAAAAELLCLCSLLHPDAIPEEFLEKGAPELGPVLYPIASDLYQLDQSIATLRNFSLIRRHPETRMLSLHRLVQQFIKEFHDPAVIRQWPERIVCALNLVFPSGAQLENWPDCQRYLAQVENCAQLIKQWNITTSEAGRLLHKVGAYAQKRALYELADQFLTQALAIRRLVLGTEHIDIAESLNELAMLYRMQGRYNEARTFYLQALHIRQQQLEPGHMQIAESLNDLALLYWAMGKYKEAEPLFQQALSIGEQQPELDHAIASIINNLALLYWTIKKYVKAEPLFLRALHIWEQTLGPEHPQVAIGLNNLARLYSDLGNYEQAEPLHKKALHIRESKLGAEHPETAISLNSLARLYAAQGKYEQAESLFQRALTIRERQLGAEHPSSATTVLCLANLYSSQKRYEEAEPLFQRALTIRRQRLGNEHALVIESLCDIAASYSSQGRYEEADVLFQQALRIWKQHPDAEWININAALSTKWPRER
jgi:tetratricopeptide (TPR) repeat protein/DNA-binding XRE family transcriptional regulator